MDPKARHSSEESVTVKRWWRKLYPLTTSGVLLLVSVTYASANDTQGFFAGIRFEHELATVDHTKTVNYNAGVLEKFPSGSSRTATSTEEDGINAFMAHLGYRTFLSERIYLSGEVEGAVYSTSVQGVMQGTQPGPLPDSADYVESHHVFPGVWALKKNHGIGFNARLGHVPQGFKFLGEGRSVYLISGVKWLDATFENSYDNLGHGAKAIRGVTRKSRSAVPWLIGGGLEFGSSKNRFDVRVQYSSWSIDSASGDGLTETTAHVSDDFEVDEVGVSLGYTRSFAFGM